MPGGGGVGRLVRGIDSRLVNPPLLEVNVTCPPPDGSGMESTGAAYVMDTEDIATSPAESVALT